MAGLSWQVARVLYSDRGHVRLRFSRPEFCQRCRRGEGCGAGVFSGLFPRRATEIEVISDHRLSPGDWVRVGLAQRTLALAAVRAYGLPVVAFLAGALPAHWLVAAELWRDLLALTGGLIAAAGVIWLSQRLVWSPTAPKLEPLSCEAKDTKSLTDD